MGVTRSCPVCGHPDVSSSYRMPWPNPARFVRLTCCCCRQPIRDNHLWTDETTGQHLCCRCYKALSEGATMEKFYRVAYVNRDGDMQSVIVATTTPPAGVPSALSEAGCRHLTTSPADHLPHADMTLQEFLAALE